MKNITIYILLLCSSLSSLAQNAPTWTSTDACLDTYVGSITIEFDHDLVEFPLPYESSYYNNTTGDYEEIMITSSPFTIGDLSPGEYELEVFISDEDIMEFCAEVFSFELEISVDFSTACKENGSISINPALGEEPYTYQWIDGSTDQNRTNLLEGIYKVTVTDANGCTAVEEVELIEAPEIFNVRT